MIAEQAIGISTDEIGRVRDSGIGYLRSVFPLIDLTEDERQALEGDREAVMKLAERLAEVPTPAGPTPQELGTDRAFISLTDLRDSIRRERS